MAASNSALRQRLYEYYNSSARYAAEMQSHERDYFHTYVELVAEYAARVVGSNRRLLDLGCGYGASTVGLARALPDYDCTGLDLSERSVAHAMASHGSARVRFEGGDCVELRFPDASFAIVASCDMLEHVPEPARALAEMARVTRPGGIVVIKGPHHRNPLLPLADLLACRARYPLTRHWWENAPRFAELAVDYARKSWGGTIAYRTREPDLSDQVQVGDDADAVYEVSVLDLTSFFRRRGFTILNIGAPRRNRLVSRLYTRALPYFASIGLVALKASPPP